MIKLLIVLSQGQKVTTVETWMKDMIILHGFVLLLKEIITFSEVFFRSTTMLLEGFPYMARGSKWVFKMNFH